MFNFPEIEEKILKNWREKDIFNKFTNKHDSFYLMQRESNQPAG